MNQTLWENLFRKDEKEPTSESVLKKCPIFSDLSRRELKLLKNSVHIRKYQQSEYVFRQDEIGVGMYFIVSGSVNVFFENPENEKAPDHKPSPAKITQLRKYDFFGELALVETESRRRATVQVNSETTLIGFFQPDLIAISERSPSTGVKILFRLSEILGRRLAETSNKINELKKQLTKIKA